MGGDGEEGARLEVESDAGGGADRDTQQTRQQTQAACDRRDVGAWESAESKSESTVSEKVRCRDFMIGRLCRLGSE